MGSTIDKLNKLVKTKAEIKEAIINKGVEVSDDIVFADYPAKIEAIDTSGTTFFNTITKNNTDYSYLFVSVSYDRIPDLSNWDTSNVTNMSCMFYGTDFYYSTSLDLSSWDTSSLTKADFMFHKSSNLRSLNLSGWDTSGLTDMNHMFQDCSSLGSLDLTGWDTSNVTEMGYTFANTLFDSLDLRHFNMNKVTIITSMFEGCECLQTLYITGWDTSNVKYMADTFKGCSNLRDIIGELDASKVNGFYYMGFNPFRDCDSLETLYLKNIYKDTDISNDVEFSIMLGGTKVKDECLIYIINELPDLYAKGLTSTGSIRFELPPTNTLTPIQVQPAIDKGWQVYNTNY